MHISKQRKKQNRRAKERRKKRKKTPITQRTQNRSHFRICQQCIPRQISREITIRWTTHFGWQFILFLQFEAHSRMSSVWYVCLRVFYFFFYSCSLSSFSSFFVALSLAHSLSSCLFLMFCLCFCCFLPPLFLWNWFNWISRVEDAYTANS